MVTPRKPKDIQRIIKRAKYPSAEADLKEFDRLLAAETFLDPSVEPSPVQRREKSARVRRLKVLNRRLGGEALKRRPKRPC
jgi:hypothetical protein